MEPAVYKFQIGYDPKYRGSLAEFTKGLERVEVSEEEIAPGVRGITIYFGESMYQDYCLADSPEAMEAFANKINDEIYDMLNAPETEVPPDQEP